MVDSDLINMKKLQALIVTVTLFCVLSNSSAQERRLSSEQTTITPIKTLWWIVAEAVTKQNVGAVQGAILQWRDVGTFDAFSIGLLPPTFMDLDSSIALANQLHQLIPQRLILGAFPSGTEGWETSFNQWFAQQLAPLGIVYDSTKAMSREAWLEHLQALEASTWAYVLEQPARHPTAAEVGASVSAFVQHAREQNKGVVLWLSAMMLRQPIDIELVRHLVATVGEQVEAIVWMDVPIVSQDPGRSLEGILDTILTLTPPQKAMIQWTHNPNLITKDTAGTLTYIATCQARGINRFVLLANPSLLQQEPWTTFYHNLPRTTSVEGNDEVPQGFMLYQNYPNPFNPSTTIRFSLPHRSHVTLKVFDVLGREVATLVGGELNAGEHSVVYDAKDLPSGLYFYRLSSSHGTCVKSALLLK